MTARQYRASVPCATPTRVDDDEAAETIRRDGSAGIASNFSTDGSQAVSHDSQGPRIGVEAFAATRLHVRCCQCAIAGGSMKRLHDDSIQNTNVDSTPGLTSRSSWRELDQLQRRGADLALDTAGSSARHWRAHRHRVWCARRSSSVPSWCRANRVHVSAVRAASRIASASLSGASGCEAPSTAKRRAALLLDECPGEARSGRNPGAPCRVHGRGSTHAVDGRTLRTAARTGQARSTSPCPSL